MPMHQGPRAEPGHYTLETSMSCPSDRPVRAFRLADTGGSESLFDRERR